MTPSSPSSDRLRDLILRWCDDRLTDAETSELDGLLRDAPEAIALFAELSHVNASLENFGPAPTPPALPSPPILGTLSRLHVMGLAAALTLLAGAVGFFLPRPTAPAPMATNAEPAPDWVAVIQHVIGFSASSSLNPRTGPDFRSGQLIAPGRIALDTGLIYLQFFNGVQLVIQGPADFDIVSAEESICREGKFHAVVPPHANGFKMRSPLGDLVDFGTEYGLDLRRDAAPSLHVFDGEVDFRPREQGTSPARLGGGQAATLRSDGVAGSGASDPDLFASFREMNRLQAITNETRLAAWFQRSRFWRSHPSVLAYFDFEERDYLAGTVLGDSPNPYAPAPEGLIIGAVPREGRWPGKTALAFQRLSDRVRVNLPGTHHGLTLLTWVRLDRAEPRWHTLLASQNQGGDSLRWRINAASGTLAFDVGESSSISRSHPALSSTGTWVCLATSFDAKLGKTEHYLDGHSLGMSTLPAPGTVRLGIADLGNVARPTSSGDHHLSGSVDELMIFSSVLGAEQILEIVSTGSPE